MELARSKGKAATINEEPVAMDKLGDGRRDPFIPSLKEAAIEPESPRASRGGKGGSGANRSEGTKKDEKGKVDLERLSSRVPEIMAVGPERPREFRRKESEGERIGIDSTKECGRKGPPTPNPGTVVVGPKSLRMSRAEEGGSKKT